MAKLLAWVGATVLGAVGWWLGARAGFFTAFIVSTIASGFGYYFGRRISDRYLT